MRRQTRLDVRDLRGGNTWGRVGDGIASVAGGVASGGNNSHYGPGVFCDLAVLAAAFNGSVFAQSRASAKKRNHAGGNPTGEWTRLAARRAAGANPELALTEAATAQLRRLREAGSLPKECAVAIDKTLFRRWDAKPGDALVRGRTERGRQAFEAHMTAQCTQRGAGTAMAVCRYLPHHTVGGQLSLMGSRVAGACDAAGIRPLLLMDREFFTAGSVAGLNALGVKWLMPCPNTPRVIAALREFGAGERGRVSAMLVSDGHGREAEYTMIIVRRRRPGAGGNPEDMYIAFAASGADIKIKRSYMRRWGIETGYRMVGNSRIKTPGRSEDVRTLAFVMSLSVHNSWAMVCAAARLATRGGWVTQAEFRLGMVMEMIASVLESRPEPEPPPAVAP